MQDRTPQLDLATTELDSRHGELRSNISRPGFSLPTRLLYRRRDHFDRDPSPSPTVQLKPSSLQLLDPPHP